jgi:hypothetical protein
MTAHKRTASRQMRARRMSLSTLSPSLACVESRTIDVASWTCAAAPFDKLFTSGEAGSVWTRDLLLRLPRLHVPHIVRGSPSSLTFARAWGFIRIERSCMVGPRLPHGGLGVFKVDSPRICEMRPSHESGARDRVCTLRRLTCRRPHLLDFLKPFHFGRLFPNCDLQQVGDLLVFAQGAGDANNRHRAAIAAGDIHAMTSLGAWDGPTASAVSRRFPTTGMRSSGTARCCWYRSAGTATPHSMPLRPGTFLLHRCRS